MPLEHLSPTRRLGVCAALLTAMVTASALLPATTAQAADQRKVETWAAPGDVVVSLTGHGYGHGHGLSQNGAQGAALQGLDWKQIVDLYYPGTTWARLGGRIKVLITEDTTSDVQVVARRGLRVRSLDRRTTWTLPRRATTRWRMLGKTGGTTVVQFKQRGGWRTWKRFKGDGEFSSKSGRTTLVVPGDRVAYRGRLRLTGPRGARRARDTVNVVSLESYLRGVVPLEVPALWEPNAVAAQSVAARTYAAAERSHPNAGHYDLCDTSLCQVYGGLDAEHPASDAAISMTSRQGLTYEGRPAFTQFSASNGGWSSAGSVPYLVAQADPYDGWSGNADHTWTQTFDDRAIEKHWPAIGDLTAIEVISRDGNGEWGGRVQDMAFVGTTGRATVTGDTVRSVLGLRSDWFTFTVGPRSTRTPG